MSTSPALGLLKDATAPLVCMSGGGPGKQNANPHACEANTLLTESQALDTVLKLSTEPRA